VPDTTRSRRYAKPLVVADDPRGAPRSDGGVIILPRHLDWSGAANYNLDSPARLVDLYRTVLIEATRPEDLHAYLDQKTLKRLWSYLWLPGDLRRAWEDRFPRALHNQYG